jgi:hypothetical protein
MRAAVSDVNVYLSGVRVCGHDDRGLNFVDRTSPSDGGQGTARSTGDTSLRGKSLYFFALQLIGVRRKKACEIKSPRNVNGTSNSHTDRPC